MTTTADNQLTPAASGTASATQSKATLGFTEKVGYAAGDFASCLYFGIFMNFLTIYYTDVMVIGAASAAAMLFFTRTWDWINDIIMGALADRTNTKMGKFRPWLLWMTPPYVIVGILTFTAFDFGPTGRLVYAYITYTALTMIYTMINIPYSALLGVMTANSEERTVLSSYRFIGAFAGVTLVSVSLPYLVSTFGGGDDRVGYSSTVTLYAALAAAAFLFTFKTTKERIKPPAQQKTSFKADIKALAKNGPWVTMIGVSVLTIIWIAVRSSTTMHFFKYAGPQSATIPVLNITVDGGEKLGGWFLGVNNGVQIVGVLMTKYFARWFGSKKRAFMVVNFAAAVWIALFYFIDTTDFWMIVGHQVIASLIYASLMPMFWSMIADTADYGAWKLGQRSTGLLFSAGTFSQKIGWSIGPSMGLALLSFYGFEANQKQGEDTLHGLLLIMSIIPAVLAVLAGAAVYFYKIDGKVEKEMAAALEAERAAEAEAAAVPA